jgi:hypothetical protein
MTAFKAGLVYFSLVFALGFVLGTIRVLLLAPRFGDIGALLLEVPIMLAASWLACGWIIRRFGVARRAPDRLVMGGFAFALLMVAEFGVSVLAFGRSPAEHFSTYRTGSAALGLLAQLVFAAMPLLRRVTPPAPNPTA